MKYPLSTLFISAVMLGTVSFNAMATETQCMSLGGTGMANAIDATHLIASLTGSFQGGARAEILKELKTQNGLILDMEHYFFTHKGGLLRTRDKATLTNVAGRPNVYMLEISYEIQESSGAFDGYKGGFSSAGLLDLNIGEVVLRYNGEICK